jgi:ArsR family transcriptional regulator
MSDESRLVVLALLKRRKEMCACEVQAALDLTHGTISHHMALLADAELVTVERRGKWAFYSIPASAKGLIP